MERTTLLVTGEPVGSTTAHATALDATFEIFFMLFVAFILGIILGRLWTSNPRSTRAPRALIEGPHHDDLRLIEGIGPKIERLLKDEGIRTFETLSLTPVEKLQQILVRGGDGYRLYNPATWPEQALFARKKEWVALQKYQDSMKNGVKL